MSSMKMIAAAGCLAMLSISAAGLAQAQTPPATPAPAAAPAGPPPNNTEVPPLSPEHAASNLPNIIIIATGGTLAGAATDGNRTAFQSYRAGTYPMADLIAELPNEELFADVSVLQFGNRGSGGYRIVDYYALSQTVDAALEIYDGVVITTGTDTMEEFAYFMDLTVQSEKPVVFTGAMRPWDVVGTDGPANLYNALVIAASGQTTGFGTVLSLNDEIHAAREVTKLNSHRMDTFDTPMLGMLGFVDEGTVRIYRVPPRALLAGTDAWATPFDLSTITPEDLPAVEIAYNYQEAGGGAIRGFVADGAAGIVTAGTGAGGISSAMSAARAEAVAAGVVFATTTRTGSGSIGNGGGEGVIQADNLNAQHARLLLLLSLAFTDDIEVMRGWFTTIGASYPATTMH